VETQIFFCISDISVFLRPKQSSWLLAIKSITLSPALSHNRYNEGNLENLQ